MIKTGASRHGFTSRESARPERHIRELQDDVLSWLRENRGWRTFDDIRTSRLRLDLTAHPALLSNLIAHARVAHRDDALSYNPVHPGVNNVDDLRALLARHRQGLSVQSLADAYVGVEADVQTLKESELIYAIANTESKETMLYPRDARLEVQVDDDIKRLWDDVNMPGDDVELERELHAAGLMSVDELETGHQTSARMKRPTKRAPKGRAPQKKRRYQLTNVHVLDQYDWLRESSK
ncbi:TFA2 Winged helix domain-containing protein [Plasmodiophora brassicae]|uniref:TFA2 Winged helix domain-containing protein n=2 Tax=Plasmodiophora brassicae TaxID=37360 RepID=A0A3P3Y900_PLABS|nr:unnamed protein product [Plasmodiophora brassicae]